MNATRQTVLEKLLTEDREHGHELLEKERTRVECETVGGVKPARGLWVFHPEKRKLAGRITMVRRTGAIVLRNYFGALFETTGDKLDTNGYTLAEQLPEGTWQTLGDDTPRVLDEHDKARFLTPTTDGEGRPVPEPKQCDKVVRSTTPCLCGCGEPCKSRFLMGHDAKLKSALRKADKPLQLTQEQLEYLNGAKWMNEQLWKSVSKHSSSSRRKDSGSKEKVKEGKGGKEVKEGKAGA